MNEYIRVLWKHRLPDEPIEMHYEVLPDRTVPRMVEIFIDGRAHADRLDWHASRYPSFVGASLVGDDMMTAEQIRATVDEDTPGEFEFSVAINRNSKRPSQRRRRLSGPRERSNEQDYASQRPDGPQGHDGADQRVVQGVFLAPGP